MKKKEKERKKFKKKKKERKIIIIIKKRSFLLSPAPNRLQSRLPCSDWKNCKNQSILVFFPLRDVLCSLNAPPQKKSGAASIFDMTKYSNRMCYCQVLLSCCYHNCISVLLPSSYNIILVQLTTGT